jgi:phage gp46-like protein
MATLATGSLSLVIDPITRDLIDSADGWFVESTDSRTMVLFQLESTYQAWWGDPTSGSRIRALLRGDEPATAQDVADETLRALQPLVDDGIISDLTVGTDVDEAKRTVILLTYRDRTSGRPVDLAYVPFGG